MDIITIEDGWDNQIKKEVVDVLEKFLDERRASTIIGALFDDNNVTYTRNYTICFNMTEQNRPHNNHIPKQLYEKHNETIQSYLDRRVLPAIQAVDLSDPVPLLEEIKFRWDNHTIMNKWYDRFLAHLNVKYTELYKKPSLNQNSLTAFKTRIYERIQVGARDAVLTMIEKDRDGEIIKNSLVKSTVKLFEDMGIGSLDLYESDLELALLESTRKYYSLKRKVWIDSDSTPDYLIKVEQVLANEINRVKEYLNPKTEAKLLKVVDDELLQKSHTKLLTNKTSGCEVLLTNNKVKDLQRMFNLFRRLEENGLDPMADIVKSHILSQGQEVLNQRQARIDGEWKKKRKEKNHDPAFLISLIKLHQKYLDLVKTEFAGHSRFDTALKDAFVKFINEKVGKFKTLELLSSFCDRLLKSGGEKLIEGELEESFEKVVQLFLYLKEMDRFGDIYRNQLAKRLLAQTSIGIDAEKSLIGKLKMHCGAEFTRKLEGMLTDLVVGSDQQSNFGRTHTDIDFSVQILTNGNWPTYETPNVTLPYHMINCIDSFASGYTSQHTQRTLKWIYSIGNTTVKAIYGRKTYDLEMTTLQAIALNALNDGRSLSYNELKDEINLEDNIFELVMHSLCCGKYKVVSKSPANSKISETDKFVANSTFKSKSRKVRIPMGSLEKANSARGVEESRVNAIEASIVRIMKSRKTLKHQDLVGEVLAQLKLFTPDSRQIKKKIEALIERDYLERSTENNQIYNYLA